MYVVGVWTPLGKFFFGEYIFFWEFLNTLIKIILLLFYDYMSGFIISLYSPDNFFFFKTIRQQQRRWADEQNFFFLSNHNYLRSEPSDNLGCYFRIHFHSTTGWSMKWTKINWIEWNWIELMKNCNFQYTLCLKDRTDASLVLLPQVPAWRPSHADPQCLTVVFH